MNRQYTLNGFEFYHNAVLNEKVYSQSGINLQASVGYGKVHLSLNLHGSLEQLMFKAGFVDAFQ